MVVTIYKESSQKKIQEGHQLDKQRNLEKNFSVIMKGRKMQAQQYDMEMEVWNEFWRWQQNQLVEVTLMLYMSQAYRKICTYTDIRHLDD